MSRRRRFTISAALVTAVMFSAGLTWAAESGLNLEKASEKTVDQFDQPNPHFELECTECHEGKPDFKTDTTATVKFVNGDEGNVALCYKCHDASENIHPVNMDPAKADPVVNVPADLPLEKRGAHTGQVVCSTCHFIHTKTAGLKLLRGFPASSDPEDAKTARYKDRRDLCKGCHGANLEKKSPHKGKQGDAKTCAFCHATQPKEGEKVAFTKGLISLCDFCHAATKGAHYLLVNPFADPNLKAEVAKSNLPLFEGSYTCVSCHDPHGGTHEPKFLRDAFVALALKSSRVRPHSQLSFCLACHKVKPTAARGAEGAQKLAEIPLLTDDMNKLCNRCHESGLSKANAHPIKAVQGKFKERIPKDWPLAKDSSLTCLTCHTAGDAPTVDPDNPNFVRGAPYASRNEICWKCHKREEFAETNPHKDIQSGEGCVFCHDSKPDLKKSVDVEQLKMKSDIVILCIRCHDEAAHPAATNHVGFFTKEAMDALAIQIPKELPLDRRGRVVCSTCHNPHAGGEKRGVVVGMEICNLCHKKM